MSLEWPTKACRVYLVKIPSFDAEGAAVRCPKDEVHLWQGLLDQMPQSGAVLSSPEHGRAERLHRSQDRERFIAGRAWLRATLARYLDVAPQALCLIEGRHGKPLLADGSLHFNLSHSGGVALLAVCRASPVGVDVEAMQPMADCDAIARRHFAAAEVERWAALPAADRLAAFYRCWTRKEAYVKALGGGLSVPLDGFEVAFEPGAEPALRSVAGSAVAAAVWSVWGIEPAPGFVAAVVAHGAGLTLRRMVAH